MLRSLIAQVVGGTLLGPDGDVSVETSIDSRAIVPGGIFAALDGERVDGHDFVQQALDQGAGLALVSREVPERPVILVDDVRRAMGKLAAAHVAGLRQGDITVIAVTGSAGKTTTKDLIARALDGPTVATHQSLNNDIGFPLTALRATEETRYLVVETGADHVGDLEYLTSLVHPDVAVVLIVGRAHLGGFGSQEAVSQAKSELVQGLAPNGIAILNADDPRVAAMAEFAPAEVVTFGVTDGDIRARNIILDEQGRASFQVEGVDVHLGLVGVHHVTNALAALAVASAAGTPMNIAAQRIFGAGADSPHRMDVTVRGGVTVIDDAYNASPDSMEAALRTLSGFEGRSIAVLGEMRELGEASEEQHRIVGRLAHELGIHTVITVGDLAVPIAKEVPTAQVLGTVDDVTPLLDTIAQDGDVVLFKAANGTGLWRVAQEWRQ